jgi:hypothetical protein
MPEPLAGTEYDPVLRDLLYDAFVQALRETNTPSAVTAGLGLRTLSTVERLRLTELVIDTLRAAGYRLDRDERAGDL